MRGPLIDKALSNERLLMSCYGFAEWSTVPLSVTSESEEDHSASSVRSEEH
jgi:hypothetical protein